MRIRNSHRIGEFRGDAIIPEIRPARDTLTDSRHAMQSRQVFSTTK